MLQVKRTEHKFIIDQKECLRLKSIFGQIMPKDKYCVSKDGYEIRTLYFDTVGDRCCAEKEDGLRFHEKIRIRIYGISDKVIKLESKKKDGEAQVKRSMKIDREMCEELIKKNYSVLLKSSEPMAAYFYRKLSDGMLPKVIIQYQRFSYCLNVNNIRITFDSNIRATESCFDLFKENLLTHPVTPYNIVILEVKFNGFLLDYIKKALRNVNTLPSSFSKYFNGRQFYRHMI